MSLFGYFSLGLQSMNAAQFGLQVAGDNIANAFTPGFSRRTVERSPGYPTQVPGGLLDSGVVTRLRRMEDMFTQANLQREHGRQAGSEERLRGLRQVESLFGSLGAEGSIGSALTKFSAAFSEVSAQPDNLALRRGAISATDGLARSIRDTYNRLAEQSQLQGQSVVGLVEQTNTLAGELAELNRQIATAESAGDVAAPLRDQRTRVVEDLVALTAGSASTASDGRIHFSLPGGPTLVTGSDALPLEARTVGGTTHVFSGADGRDLTTKIRGGKLGATLYLRDETIAGKMAELDKLAARLMNRVNALSASGTDLNGNPGGALLLSSTGSGPGVAGQIYVDPAVLADLAQLAISSTGTPGDGGVALLISEFETQVQPLLGGRSAREFLATLHTTLGDEIVRVDVEESVSYSLVQSLTAQRDAVSGVNLDEEALALVENQRAYEAAARFIQILNNVTEMAVNLGNR